MKFGTILPLFSLLLAISVSGGAEESTTYDDLLTLVQSWKGKSIELHSDMSHSISVDNNLLKALESLAKVSKERTELGKKCYGIPMPDSSKNEELKECGLMGKNFFEASDLLLERLVLELTDALKIMSDKSAVTLQRDSARNSIARLEKALKFYEEDYFQVASSHMSSFSFTGTETDENIRDTIGFQDLILGSPGEQPKANETAEEAQARIARNAKSKSDALQVKNALEELVSDQSNSSASKQYRSNRDFFRSFSEVQNQLKHLVDENDVARTEDIDCLREYAAFISFNLSSHPEFKTCLLFEEPEKKKEDPKQEPPPGPKTPAKETTPHGGGKSGDRRPKATPEQIAAEKSRREKRREELAKAEEEKKEKEEREERERLAKADQDKKDKEAAEKLAKEEAEKKAREEAERNRLAQQILPPQKNPQPNTPPQQNPNPEQQGQGQFSIPPDRDYLALKRRNRDLEDQLLYEQMLADRERSQPRRLARGGGSHGGGGGGGSPLPNISPQFQPSQNAVQPPFQQPVIPQFAPQQFPGGFGQPFGGFGAGPLDLGLNSRSRGLDPFMPRPLPLLLPPLREPRLNPIGGPVDPRLAGIRNPGAFGGAPIGTQPPPQLIPGRRRPGGLVVNINAGRNVPVSISNSRLQAATRVGNLAQGNARFRVGVPVFRRR